LSLSVSKRAAEKDRELRELYLQQGAIPRNVPNKVEIVWTLFNKIIKYVLIIEELKLSSTVVFCTSKCLPYFRKEVECTARKGIECTAVKDSNWTNGRKKEK
jgi:hypothetical protein